MKCRCPLIRERWSRCPRTNSALSPRRETFYISRRGALAQLGERLVCNQEVAGSIPVRSIRHRFRDRSYFVETARECELPIGKVFRTSATLCFSTSPILIPPSISRSQRLPHGSR